MIRGIVVRIHESCNYTNKFRSFFVYSLLLRDSLRVYHVRIEGYLSKLSLILGHTYSVEKYSLQSQQIVCKLEDFTKESENLSFPLNFNCQTIHSFSDDCLVEDKFFLKIQIMHCHGIQTVRRKKDGKAILRQCIECRDSAYSKFFLTLWERDCGLKVEQQGKFISIYCPRIGEKRQISLQRNSFVHIHQPIHSEALLPLELPGFIPTVFIEHALKTNLPVFQLKCLLFADIHERSAVIGTCSSCLKSISSMYVSSTFCFNCNASGTLHWNFSFRVICFDESASVELHAESVKEFASMKAESFAKLNCNQMNDFKYNVSFEPYLLTLRRNNQCALEATSIERIPSLS